MDTIEVDDAGAQFSRLIARVEAGEEIVIARGKEPVATLTAIKKTKRRVVGAFKGQFEVPPDSFFFDPLPDDELAAWEGRSEDPPR